MSYILDALKKAEAQRHLGGVPSIHAGASDTGDALDAQPFWRKHLPWLITGLFALALLGYVLWSQPRHVEPVPAAIVPAAAPVASAPMEQQRPAPAQETPTAAPTHAAPAVATEKPARATPPAAQAPITAPLDKPVEAAAPAAKSAPAPAPAAAAAAAATSATTAPAVAATPPASAPPAAQEDDVGTAQDLPASIQRELPQVSITGYIYARNPADRSALINKRLLHEGEIVAPDLALEKLTPRGAILNYKGYRYRVPY